MSSNSELLLRQWTMLRMIPRFPRKITAREVLQRIKREGFIVNKRTIERDLQAMSAVFPLVADEREKPYGWSWAEHAGNLDLPGMTPSQALTFKLAEQYLMKLMPHGIMDQLSPYFKAAEKCLAGSDNKTLLAKWPEKIAVAFPGQPLLAPDINSDILELVDESLLEEKQIKLIYSSRNDTEENKEYIVHPLGMILRGQLNYLVCTFFNYQDIRMLALHRVKQVEKLNAASSRPVTFDLEAYAHSGVLGFSANGKISLVIKFAKEAGLHLYDTSLSLDQTITEDDDYFLVQATVNDNAQLRWWLLGFANKVEVVEPQTLRNWFISVASKMAEIYL